MSTKSSKPSSASAQLKAFIEKFDDRNQSLLRAARARLRKRFPTAHELVYDNYNFFVIGYSPTERPSDAIVSLTANANGAGLCFIRGATLSDPAGLLSGSGNQTRFIRLPSADVLDQAEVRALMAAAERQSKVPFGKTGRGTLVIRSVSAKQRPRRKAKGS